MFLWWKKFRLQWRYSGLRHDSFTGKPFDNTEADIFVGNKIKRNLLYLMAQLKILDKDRVKHWSMYDLPY